MGGGPEHFVQNGVAQLLRECGFEVDVDCIEVQSTFRAEIKTAFDLYRTLAGRVGAAYAEGTFPLVLSGHTRRASILKNRFRKAAKRSNL